MKSCATSDEVREIENHFSLYPLDILMENAGKKSYEYISSFFDKSFSYLIVCGKGNNGGDGYVLARYLFENGYDVFVYSFGESKTELSIKNKNLYKGKYIDKLIQKEKLVIVDAIFGIGLNKDIEGKYFEIINELNSLNAYKISLDIPSGIDSNTGKILNIAFKADLTLTFGIYKLGLFLLDGKDYSKKNVLLDIGFKIDPEKYLKILEREDFQDLLFKRKENSNKGTYGKVTLIGGTRLTPGALKLSEEAYIALSLNAGYSLIAYPSSLNNIIDLKRPELIYKEFPSTKKGNIKFNKKILNELLNSKTIVIGMGIGISKEVYKIIKYLLKNYHNNLLIDADGLNSIAKYGIDILKKHSSNIVLTPHIKEFSRLINVSVKDILNDRIKYLDKFVNDYNMTVILKDNSSLIYSKNEKYLNINGNSALAKGGSGDVLSGILGAILDKNNFTKSCAFGSYLLGRSADLTLETKENYEILATDIIKNINKAYKEVEYGKE